MSNPFNLLSLTGKIASDITFKSSQAGEEFAASFILGVRRNYQNNGEYKIDCVPVTYEGVKRMGFAHTLKKGIYVTLSGAIKVDQYEKDGKSEYKMYVLAENINYVPVSEPVATEKPEQSELPY